MGWVDQPEDFPLQFAFRRKVAEEEASLSELSSASGVAVQLPAGFGANGTVGLAARVQDALGAATFCERSQAGAPLVVSVLPFEVGSTAEAADLVTNLTDGVLQKLSTLESTGSSSVVQVRRACSMSLLFFAGTCFCLCQPVLMRCCCSVVAAGGHRHSHCKPVPTSGVQRSR